MQEAQIEQAKAEKIGKNTLALVRKTRIPKALQGALREQLKRDPCPFSMFSVSVLSKPIDGKRYRC
jgi:hypothetical protein